MPFRIFRTSLVVPCVLVGIAATLLGLAETPAQAPKKAKLAAQAEVILRRYCFQCHGQDPKKIKGDGLKILDYNYLLGKERKIVVPGRPDESEMIKKIEGDEMPPGKREQVPPEERRLLREWIAADASPFPGFRAAQKDLASQAKELFRTHCLECHGGSKTNAGVKILDRDLLIAKKKVVPGKPEASKLFELITAADDSVMPPAGQPRLRPEDIEIIRRWIAAGAPPAKDVDSPPEKNKEEAFKDVVGVEYVHKQILAHVTKLPVKDRPFARYFSINHLLNGGVTREELDLQRDALAKALNHLSWEKKLVIPEPIDKNVNSIFVVDIRKLGWDRQPFIGVQGNKKIPSPMNIFDLALLEYPYAVLYEDSPTFQKLTKEFLALAAQVRPVVYVRADWFVSTATLPPLYNDLLQLPLRLQDLEKALGVEADANRTKFLARRAGLTVSGVANHNRALERHRSPNGAFWQSFDYRSSKGPENIFKDPIDLRPAAGEMIFNLPNGLQGYYVADGQGNRLDFADTEIVTDKFAQDKTVRNGLSCMRCHDGGMKDFEDKMRPAVQRLPGIPGGFNKNQVLQLYAPKAEMDQLLKQDTERFTTALQKAVGKVPLREPLTPVSLRFLEAPIPLSAASAELGLAKPAGLETIFRLPRFSSLGLEALAAEGGVLRRDMWEDYYDQVVRELGLGVPVVPLDGLTRPDYQSNPSPKVELATNHKDNVFQPGDTLEISITNKSKENLFIELVVTKSNGEKGIVDLPRRRIKPGHLRIVLQDRIEAGKGKERLTLLASDKDFPAGVVLRADRKLLLGGKGQVADRVVHSFYPPNKGGNGFAAGFPQGASILKKTLIIETR